MNALSRKTGNGFLQSMKRPFCEALKKTDLNVRKKIADFVVEANLPIGEAFSQLHLYTPDQLPEIEPGQFAQVGVPASMHGWLRIPISIHDADTERGHVKLLVQKVGTGSEWIASLKKGDRLNLILPLGKGFSLPASGSAEALAPSPVANFRALLVGGGAGLAPLYFLAKRLKRADLPFDILIGARNKARLVLANEMAELGPTGICTEDGSVGFRGLVTGHPLWKGVSYTHVYACGPTPMMKAVAVRAAESGAVCQVSLENTMACGLGACLCCVTATAEGRHACVCTEGPVFDARALGW